MTIEAKTVDSFPRRRYHPPARSQAVKWWQLINDAESFRNRTGWGLAVVWGHIHRGEYERARRAMDEIEAMEVPSIPGGYWSDGPFAYPTGGAR